MVKDALEASAIAGIHGFWSLTPFELSLHLEAYNKRSRSDYQMQCWQTWHIAALSRCSKMPKLKDFVNPVESTAESNERSLEAVLMARVKSND